MFSEDEYKILNFIKRALKEGGGGGGGSTILTPLTQDEYDELKAQGLLKPDVFYLIKDEEV